MPFAEFMSSPGVTPWEWTMQLPDDHSSYNSLQAPVIRSSRQLIPG